MSDKDYFKLKKYKWRYIKGGSFITNIKLKNGRNSSTTINKILGFKLYHVYVYKDGNILNISRNNRILLNSIKKEKRKEKLIKLKKLSINNLDSLLLLKIKKNPYIGVILNNEGKNKNLKYRVVIYNKRNYNYFGVFVNPQKAAKVYNQEVVRLRKNNIRLNIIN